MKLTYASGNFYLGLTRFANPLEACSFRKFADSNAERMFKKLLLEVKPLPLRGLNLSPSNLTLMPFQKEKGIPHILKMNRSYLAHQPGLGKSAQAICAVSAKPGRTLIFCPSFLRITWAREITKWFLKDFPSIAIVPPTPRQLEMNWNADFVICSDAMILKPWVRLGILKSKFRFVFIDEAHRFKNHLSARTVAMFGGQTGKLKSPGLIYDAEHVCALSGTPMLNRPIELWSVLFAMAPQTIDFKSFEDFGFKFCGAYQDDWGHWNFNGASNEDELRKRIMPGFMQRIRKEDVLEDLPDKIREVIVMDQDPRSPEAQAMDRSLAAKIMFKRLENLETFGDYAKLRHQNGLSKVEWVGSFVYSLLSENLDESIILFAHHRDVVEQLAKSFSQTFPAMVINGGVSVEERTRIEDAFQSGKRRLLIGNIDAMNLGLTLTRATRVVFAEYSWTPSLNEQAEDRAHRIGKKDSVFCQYIVLPNSMDETILSSLLKKENVIGKVIG